MFLSGILEIWGIKFKSTKSGLPGNASGFKSKLEAQLYADKLKANPAFMEVSDPILESSKEVPDSQIVPPSDNIGNYKITEAEKPYYDSLLQAGLAPSRAVVVLKTATGSEDLIAKSNSDPNFAVAYNPATQQNVAAQQWSDAVAQAEQAKVSAAVAVQQAKDAAKATPDVAANIRANAQKTIDSIPKNWLAYGAIGLAIWLMLK